MSKIETDVRELIAEQLGVDVEQVTDEKNIVDDLDADSLDVVELVIGIEEQFDIEIPEDEAEKLVTVKDIVKYVTHRNGR